MTNQEYTKQRNALIPQAETAANRIQGKTAKDNYQDPDDWARNWNLTFLAAMDRLARKEGLVV
jgi:hypothetical protein